MKQTLIAMLLMLPLAHATAQDDWNESKPAVEQAEATSPYLKGAVPEVDGKVVFETVITVPGKTKEQLVEAVGTLMEGLAKDENQTGGQSRVSLKNEEQGIVAGSFQEWMVFKSTALVLDRTRFCYQLIANCNDGEVDLQLVRIIFIYDEERQPQTYKAEEWITDRYGLTRKQDKLARVSGKFRRMTIDRKNFLFDKFNRLLNK